MAVRDLDELLESGHSESSTGYRVKELKAYVSSDRALLDRFHKKAMAVTRRSDPKLTALVETLKTPLASIFARSALSIKDWMWMRGFFQPLLPRPIHLEPLVFRVDALLTPWSREE